MFCALLGQDIRCAFTGPLVLWFTNVMWKSGITFVRRCFRDDEITIVSSETHVSV